MARVPASHRQNTSTTVPGRRSSFGAVAWSTYSDALRGRVTVVAGATRGAGRGIAAALGEAGATVVCTGRTTRAEGSARSDYERSETIEKRPSS